MTRRRLFAGFLIGTPWISTAVPAADSVEARLRGIIDRQRLEAIERQAAMEAVTARCRRLEKELGAARGEIEMLKSIVRDYARGQS
jgi:hypothetical protein